MKLHYYPDTDSLYIDFGISTRVDSHEIAENIVADFGEEGRIVGLDIQHASQSLDLSKIETEHPPLPISA